MKAVEFKMSLHFCNNLTDACKPMTESTAYCSWYTPSFTGSTYPSVSSTNTGDHEMVSEQYCSLVSGCWLSLSLCLCVSVQSLWLHQGNICILLPVNSSWLCHHNQWVPMDVGPYLLLVRRRETPYRNSCVILFTPPPSLNVYSRHFFSQSTNVYSALGADFSELMRYINSRFTYLLTYLPPVMSLSQQSALLHYKKNVMYAVKTLL